jgi:hypothetical protein
MGKYQCPLCFVRVPWTALLAHSYELECPACHAGLELSRYTRVVAGFAGMAGAWAAVHLAQGASGDAEWVLTVVAAVLGFGFASAAGVLAVGDVVVHAKDSSPSFPHPAK